MNIRDMNGIFLDYFKYYTLQWRKFARVLFVLTACGFGHVASRGAANAPAGQTAVLELVADPAGAGTVIGSGTYAYGKVVSIQAVPAKHYVFSKWQGHVVNPRAATTNVYIGREDQRIFATFEKERHMVSVKINPEGAGVVMGAGFQEAGIPASLMAEPAKGYEFDRWEGDVTDKNAVSVKTTKPLVASVELVAHFKPVSEIYRLEISSSPAQGGRVTGAGTYRRGDSVKIEAIPNRSYRFNGWEGAPVGFSGDAKTTVFMTGNISLKAKFLLNTSMVAASVSPAGAGQVRGANDYLPVEAPAEVVAEPAAGYRFVRWEGPVADPAKARTTVTPLAGRRTEITAVFSPAR